jgi:hypothetical protein
VKCEVKWSRAVEEAWAGWLGVDGGEKFAGGGGLASVCSKEAGGSVEVVDRDLNSVSGFVFFYF